MTALRWACSYASSQTPAEGEPRDAASLVCRETTPVKRVASQDAAYVFPAAMMMRLLILMGTFAVGFVQAATLDAEPHADLMACDEPAAGSGLGATNHRR